MALDSIILQKAGRLVLNRVRYISRRGQDVKEFASQKVALRWLTGSISSRFGIAVVYPPPNVRGKERGLTKRLEIEPKWFTTVAC